MPLSRWADLVRLGTGVIGAIGALVLGLLIASAKTSYDTQGSQVRELTANISSWLIVSWLSTDRRVYNCLVDWRFRSFSSANVAWPSMQ